MADKKTELMAQFYAECQQKGYTDMTDDTQSLKAKVIATDLKLNYGNIVSFYEKAKSCYEQVQKEKAEAERLRAIQQQKEAQERARRQVDGELLVTLSDRAYESDETTSVRVYIRPDNTVYSTVNNGSKIEGAPQISVKKGGVLLLTYHPSQAVYTGATVGGITTGGVHYTQSGYTASETHSGKGDIEISVGGRSFILRLIKMSGYTCKSFNRDGQFKNLVHKGQINCYVESDKANLYYESIKTGRLDHQTMMNALSMAADEQRLTYAMCERIIHLLGRVVHGQFPPSDEQIYDSAKALENASTSAELNRAIELYNSISDYKDSAKQAQAMYAKYEEVLQAEKEQAILEKEATAKKTRRICVVALASAIIITSLFLLVTQVILPLSDYNNAILMMESGNYDEAINSFTRLGDYKDTANKLEECISLKEQAELQAAYDDAIKMMAEQRYDDAILAFINLGTYSDASSKAEECVNLQKKPFYDEAISLAESGKIAEAAIAFGKLGDYADARDRSLALWDTIAVRDTIVLDGDGTAAAVKTDGSVVAVLPSTLINQDAIAKLTNIVSISIGEDYILGLKENGTVVVAGFGFTWEDGRIYTLSGEISDLTNVVAISAADNYVVVLKTDGTVIGFAEDPKSKSIQVADWENIVAISTAGRHTVGLKADGSVVAVGDNKYGECDVSEWTDIVAISTGQYYTVGLKSDGTVVVTGGSGYSIDAGDLRKLSRWADIVAISAGDQSVAGLKSDGTVVAVFPGYSKKSDAPDWTDIVAVVMDYRFIGLKADGTVVIDGAYSAWPYKDKFNWSNWYDIRIPKI